jgi:hypothetical protein
MTMDQSLQPTVKKILNIDSYVDDVLSSTSAYNNIIPTGHKGKRRQVKEMIQLWQKKQDGMNITTVKYRWKDYHKAVCASFLYIF